MAVLGAVVAVLVASPQTTGRGTAPHPPARATAKAEKPNGGPRPTTVDPTSTTEPVTSTTEPVTSTTSSVPSDASGSPPLLVDQLASTDGARQVLVVDAPDAASTTATLTAYENDGGGWYQVFGAMPAVDSVNGWVPGPSRTEGDDTTPEGIYAIGPTMYGTEPDPGTQFPYHQLVCGDWWDEDPSSPNYNTFQHVPCGTTPPFGGDSEALWTEGNAYPSMAVIDYNTPPTGPLGSGIFLHADIGVPNEGCVSLPLSDLDAVLAWLNPSLHPVIVMGPDTVIRSF
jgi:L,D-peptidoglycan transpeptidase YkuD (ErfK/YbiS/YcfS/YnhG family)